MSSKEIVLVHPPSPMLEQEKVVPPLGILYLAAVLQDAGHQVRMLDVGREKIDLREFANIEFVGVSTTTPQYPEALNILRAIRKEKRHFPIVAVGGPHATAMKERLLLDDWDYVCVGEGERAIISLVEGKHDGKLIIGERVSNLDSLPLPAYHLFDLKSYQRPGAAKPTAPLLSSRGCPFHCTFCAKEVSGRIVRYHSPERFIDQVRMIKERFGIDQFMIYDDIFTLVKERVKQICQRLTPLGITWRCQSHVRTIDKERLTFMQKAGCLEIAYGVENPDDRVLEYFGKGTTVEDNKRAIAITKEAGIRVKIYLMFGSALDSFETARGMINFIEETEPDDVQLSVLTPLPGSEMYAHPERFDLQFDVNDLGAYYHCGGGGKAGNVIRSTKFLSPEEFENALDMLYGFLEEWRTGKQGVSI